MNSENANQSVTLEQISTLCYDNILGLTNEDYINTTYCDIDDVIGFVTNECPNEESYTISVSFSVKHNSECVADVRVSTNDLNEYDYITFFFKNENLLRLFDFKNIEEVPEECIIGEFSRKEVFNLLHTMTDAIKLLDL